MDVREKLVELSDIQVLQREIECVKRKSATNCADCLNCDLLMTDERILSAYANAIDALQNANGVTVQEWISVEDRLPEDDIDVLAYSSIGEESRIYPACYSNGVWFDCVFNATATDTTTHWMPLPSTEGLE